MKKILTFLLVLLFLYVPVQGIEVVRQKNVATYVYFPIVDGNGDVVTGAAGLDSEVDTWTDGVAPDGFEDCTNEATEIGTDGIYYLSLTQAEMNVDYIYLQVKSTTSIAKTQHILIRTIVGDPLNLATTTSGGEMSLSSGKVTVGTNDDKTGYGLADGAITSAKFGANAITAEKIADDAFDYATFAGTAPTAWWNEGKTGYALTTQDWSTHSAADVWASGTRTITGMENLAIKRAAIDTSAYARLWGDDTTRVVTYLDWMWNILVDSLLDGSGITYYWGACDGCYQRLFPVDGSANKDSIYIIDPSQDGVDTLVAKVVYHHKNTASVVDSIFYYRNPWW